MNRDDNNCLRPVVAIEHLCKSYGKRQVIADLSFEVRSGEIFGFLGPNGAGKTTTLEIVEGLRRADSGSVKVFGLDVQQNLRAIRERIGVSLQTSHYWGLLTVRETITLFQSFYRKVLALDELVEMFALAECLDRPVRQLSGGNYQRVVLALAMVNDPELVLLDEPTTGLDPAARRRLWEIVKESSARGRTIILTTHYMEEAHALCSRVAMIAAGRIVQCGTPDELIRAAAVELAISFSSTYPFQLDSLNRLVWCKHATQVESGRYLVYCDDMQQGLHGLLTWAAQTEVRIADVEMRSPTLDDVFLKNMAPRGVPA